MTDEFRPAREITEKLRHWRAQNGTDSADDLLRLVYDELRRQAHQYLQKERGGHTLQTTALVHEAYLNLTKRSTDLPQRTSIWQR